MRALAVLAALLLAGCVSAPPVSRGGGGILVLGDSVLAWNGGAVGDLLYRQLDRPVTDRSRSGARVSHPSVLARTTGFDIGERVVPGRFDWAVMNGGANDLRAECGCASCDATLDTLLAPDGQSGEIADLVARVRRAGAQRVLLLGYYGPSGRGGGFDVCSDELAELDTRLSRLAASDDAIRFVDGGAVMSDATPTLYGPDNVHPSQAGSAALGGLLADTIRTAETR